VTGGQPNIHPGSISSTGRGRVGGTATSTQAAQLIGGGITPNMFTSPATVSTIQKFIFLLSKQQKYILLKIIYFRRKYIIIK